MLNQATPTWLRSPLSAQLSLIPLRPHGVRQTINFVASSFAKSPAPKVEGSTDPSQGPPLPPEALAQASMLLSRIPSTITDKEYFSTLAPQLWDLLDGEGGVDMSKAAGYIICGVLSRKSTGAPGSAGWSSFATPLICSIDPPSSTTGTPSISTDGSITPVVSESDLRRSLTRMARITQSQPNPGVTNRLIGPLVMPLWALAAFAYERSADTSGFWVQSSFTLLRTLFRLTTNAKVYMDMIVNDILFEGRENYAFAPASNGGIEIRVKDPNENFIKKNRPMLEIMTELSSRVKLFMSLIDTKEVTVSDIIDTFLILTRKSLVSEQVDTQDISSKGYSIDVSYRNITAAILVPEILATYSDKFAQNSVKILELGKQLLEEFVNSSKSRISKSKAKALGVQSLHHIASLTESSTPESINGTGGSELLTLAVSLFNSTISSPDFKPDDATNHLLDSVHRLLGEILRIPSIETDLRQAVNTLLSMLKPSSATNAVPYGDRLRLDRETLSDAQKQAADTTQPPYERIKALETIRSLVSSPAVDLPSLTLLLLHIIQTESDEAIYLAGINALTTLASTHNKIATQLTLDTFIDIDENTVISAHNEYTPLDARLRIGEALSRISESLTDSDGSIARLIAEGMIKVAGRRGERPKEQSQRQKRKRLEEAEKRKADREGILNFSPQLAHEDETMNPEDQQMLENIVKGWEETGLEEDVRIRVSALSVISQILRYRLQALSQNIIDTTVDLIIAVINLEKVPEKSILRRAAVLATMSLVQATSTVGSPTKVLSPAKWDEVEKVITWAADMDDDTIVRGHAKEVQDELVSWRMSLLFGSNADGTGLVAPRVGLEGRLRGLNVDVQPGASRASKKAFIEEID